MVWSHPGTVLLAVLFLFFLYRRRWGLALAVPAFILLTWGFAAYLQGRPSGDPVAAGRALSIFLTAGGIWFAVAAVVDLLAGRKA